MAPKRQRIAEDSEDGKDIQNNNANATIGQETDPVLRVFGHPSEGFQSKYNVYFRHTQDSRS